MPTTEPRKRRASIRHSLASTFSFASLSALRRHPSLASTTKALTVSPPVTTTKSPLTSAASTPNPRGDRSPNFASSVSVSERVPIIIVDSPAFVQTKDALEYDTPDEERSWSEGVWKRRKGRTTINDARFLALLTMDISQPVFLGGSYGGQVRDLPGRRGGRGDEGKPRVGSANGEVSVIEVVDLLEHVEQEFGIATARVGEGMKELRDEIKDIKRRRGRKVRVKR